MYLLTVQFSFIPPSQEENVPWCESSRTRFWFSSKEGMNKCHPPGMSWHVPACLPTLEHCSSKGHYSRKLESSSFQFLWNAGIDIYCTSFTSQEGEGSMSCKAFSSTVGAVFMACINSPMTTASQVGKVEWKRKFGEHVNANRLRTTGEGTQLSREMNSLTLFYQCQQLWGEFHTIADESIIECYCIMQETC